MPLIVEIGPGRGDFLFHLARENPASEILGIEYKRKRHDKLRRRLEKNGLTNVRLLCGDARALLPSELRADSVDTIYILFNDPWPKRRHARRRLFQEGLVEELLRVLRPGGLVAISTDAPKYREEIGGLFRRYRGFLPHGDGLHFPTFYAEKWRLEGRTIFSFSYEKRDALPTLETT